MKHTPTPWRDDGYGGLVGPDGKTVTVWRLGIAHGQRSTETEANARHIVHCVNNHERLVQALRDCEEVLSYVARKSGLTHSDAEGVAIEARALLATLEAEKGGEL